MTSQGPRFAAGLGLQLAARMLFDFKGSIFWRMQAGMGEVVFAPLYEALSRRGVQFRFFHRLDRLEVGDDRTVTAEECCQSELGGQEICDPVEDCTVFTDVDADHPFCREIALSPKSSETVWSSPRGRHPKEPSATGAPSGETTG